MSDKRKYIDEYLDKHGFSHSLLNDLYLDELYNLYKYNKIPQQINKDLYGYYGVYYTINNNPENAIRFFEMVLKRLPSCGATLGNLIDIYIKQNDEKNVSKYIMKVIENGLLNHIKNVIEFYTNIKDYDKLYSMYDKLYTDDQKYKYFVAICIISNFKFTKEMINDLIKLNLRDDTPLPLKLLKGVFNGIHI